MSFALQPINVPRIQDANFGYIVVASATQSATFDLDTETVAQWTARFASELNQLLGTTVKIRNTPTVNSRAIYIAKIGDSLASSAPAGASSYVSSLVNPQDYACYVHTTGDIWIISERVNGLRNGGYALLRASGRYYLGPSSTWWVNTTNRLASVTSHARVYAMHSVIWSSDNTQWSQPGTPGQVTGGLMVNRWARFMDRMSTPLCTNNASGDGDSSFNFYRQHELRLDPSQLQWDGVGRGHAGFQPWDGNCAANGDGHITSRLCQTHTGTNTGSYPAAAAGPTPWMSYNLAGPSCTVGSPDVAFVDPGGNDSNTAVWPNMPSLSYAGCWSGLAKLHGEFHRDAVSVFLQSQGPRHPNTLIWSISPQDGTSSCYSHGKCDALLSSWSPYVASLTAPQLATHANPGDRQAHLANSDAEFFNDAFKNAPANQRPRVGYSAYTQHGQVPNIPLLPNVHVDVNMGSVVDVKTPDEVLAGWKAKAGGTRGLETVWAYTRYVLDRPFIRTVRAIQLLQGCVDAGWIRFYNIGTLSLPMAPIIYAHNSYVHGDYVSESAALDDWFNLAFGAIAPQIRAIWNRWEDIPPWCTVDQISTFFEDSPHDVAVTCAALAAIQGTVTTLPPDVQIRFAHFQAYAHYLRLLMTWTGTWRNYKLDPTNITKQNAFAAAAEAVLMWLWRLGGPLDPQNYLVESPHIASFVRGDGSGPQNIPTSDPSGNPGVFTNLRSRWDPSIPTPFSTGIQAALAAGPPTPSELNGLISTSAATYSPIVNERLQSTYSSTMVATGSTADTTIKYSPWVEGQIQDYIFLKGASDITFKLGAGMPGTFNPDGMPVILELRDMAGNVLDSVSIPYSAVGAVEVPFTVTVAPGQYLLRLRATFASGGAIGRVGAPHNVPFALADQLICWVGFDVAAKWWFWVPSGVTRIAIQFAAGSSTVPSATGLQIYDSDGTTALTTTRLEPNIYYADVPSGHDGRAFCFTGYQSLENIRRLHFLNCPDMLSPSAEQVIRPSNAP